MELAVTMVIAVANHVVIFPFSVSWSQVHAHRAVTSIRTFINATASLDKLANGYDPRRIPNDFEEVCSRTPHDPT